MKSEAIKNGNKVARLMTRYNPQLGTYFVFEAVTVNRVNSKSISCDDGKMYDKETGRRKGEDTSIYGSADYEIMSIEEAKIIRAELETAGSRVRGMNDILTVS